MILEISLITLAILSIIAVELRDLLQAVIVIGAVDAVLALVFLLMAAPDVAITQAAVASALTTFVFIVAIFKTRREEE